MNEPVHFATLHTSSGTVEIRYDIARHHPALFLDDLALHPEDWRKVAASLLAAAEYVEQAHARKYVP